MGKPYPTPRNPLKPPTASTAPNNPNRFKTAAQREAERQAASYAGNARNYSSTSSLNDEQRLRDLLARNNNASINNEADLEAQRRYDSSNNNGDTSFYSDYAKLLGNGNSPSPVAPQSGGSPRYPETGSSGGGGGSASPQPTLADQLAAIQGMTGTIDPALRALVPTTGELEVMYGRLTDSLNQSKAGLDADYQKAIDAVKGNYGASNNLLNQAISGDNASLAQAAANMGVQNWGAGPTAQGQNELLNRLLGTSSQNQATDLSWFEKMRTLDSSQFGDYAALANFQKQSAINDSSSRLQELQEMANEVARNQAMAALEESLGMGGGSGGGYGGGGGFGRRSGGGSSSKDAYRTLSQSATQSGELDYAGLYDQVSQLDPVMQSIFWNYWVQGGSSGEGAAKAIQNDVRTGKTSYGGDANTLKYLWDLTLNYVPGYGTIYSQSTQDKTSQSTKQHGVPPITQLPPIPMASTKPTGLKGISDKLKATKGAKKPPTTKKSPKVNLPFF